MSEKEYECGGCGWVGSSDAMEGVMIDGLPSMPSGRRDLGYDCPECGEVIGAKRMKPDGQGDYEHFWDEMNGERREKPSP